MDAHPRPAWLSRVELAALAATFAVAVAAWLAFPVAPTYDSLYSLVWGREILGGAAPGFEDFGAPTQHPLWVAVGTLLAPLGDTGARAMTLLAVLSFVVLLAATYHLGRTVFGPLAGALAAALLLTRLNFGFYAAFAFVDMPFAALVMAAAALEAVRPRRGGVVWVLLIAAGLLRPEGWVFAAAYGAWLWSGADLAPAADPRAGRGRAAAVGALGPDRDRRPAVLVDVHDRRGGPARSPAHVGRDPARVLVGARGTAQAAAGDRRRARGGARPRAAPGSS